MIQRPAVAYANQPHDSDAFVEHVDQALFARKGYLSLVCSQDTPHAVAARVYERYYADPSFDIIPSLASSLRALYSEHPQARDQVLAAVVIDSLDVFVVGTDVAAAWLVHFEQVKPLLSPGDADSVLRIAAPTSRSKPDDAPLYWVQSRLAAGDIVVLSTAQLAAGAQNRAIERILHAGKSLPATANRLAQAAHRRGLGSIPVTLIGLSGFTPGPELEPVYRWPAPRPERASMRPPHAASPIGPAVIIAVVAIGISLWVSKPDLSAEGLSRMLAWILTPVPTATAARTPAPSVQDTVRLSTPVATATEAEGVTPVLEAPPQEPRSEGAPSPTAMPSPDYSLPRLLSPMENESIHDAELTLEWSWPGELADDEYFDVRLWRLGSSKSSIAWTKEHSYTERLPGNGWHSWTVVVIRGRDGVIEEVLSEEPQWVNFRWLPEGGSASATTAPATAAPAPPTRVTPITQPTRVTPDTPGK